MLSSIRRALTPTANHSEDRHLSNLTQDSSPAPPSIVLPDPSPPPFSPLEPSDEDVPPWTDPESNANEPSIADRRATSDPPDQSSLSGHPSKNLQERTSDDHLSPNTSPNLHSQTFTPINASDDHHQPLLQGALARGSPLPSVEPTQSTSNLHRTKRNLTPTEPHSAANSRVSSPQKFSRLMTRTSQPRDSPLPSTEPVQSASKAPPAKESLSQSGERAGLKPTTSSTPQPSTPAAETSPVQALGPSAAGPATTMPGALNAKSPKSALAAPDATNTSTSSTPRKSKRKREEDPPLEPESVKKQRVSPRKREGPTSSIKQPVTTKDKSSKRGGKSKKEHIATSTTEQPGPPSHETFEESSRPKRVRRPTGKMTLPSPPKKRGRPRKEAGSTPAVNPPRTPKGNPPAKRGRPRKAAKRAAEPARAVAETTTNTAPKKRGRPKKEKGGERAPRPTGSRAAPVTDSPKKRGSLRNTGVGNTGTAAGAQGSSGVGTAVERRGRPRKR